jgi:hypothetical protein
MWYEAYLIKRAADAFRAGQQAFTTARSLTGNRVQAVNQLDRLLLKKFEHPGIREIHGGASTAYYAQQMKNKKFMQSLQERLDDLGNSLRDEW